jgi:hypothetical protein
MKYLPVSLKKLKFLQNILQRYTIILEFFENFRLEVSVSDWAVRLDSPGTVYVQSQSTVRKRRKTGDVELPTTIYRYFKTVKN